MEKRCGWTLPADIRSTSNIVNLVFTGGSGYGHSGWSVSWSAVTPGECQQCNLVNLLFPFNKNKTFQLLMLSRTPDAFNPSKPCLASLSSFEFYCDPSFQKIKDRTRWSWWARDQLVVSSSKRSSVNLININSFWCKASNQLLFKKILHCRSILSNSFCFYFFSLFPLSLFVSFQLHLMFTKILWACRQELSLLLL